MICNQRFGDAVVTRVLDGLVWSLVGGPFIRVAFEFQSKFEAECPWDFVHIETDIETSTVVYQITNTRPSNRW